MILARREKKFTSGTENLDVYQKYMDKIFSLSFRLYYELIINCKNRVPWGFPGGSVVKNLPANAGDMGSSPGPGKSHMSRSN